MELLINTSCVLLRGANMSKEGGTSQLERPCRRSSTGGSAVCSRPCRCPTVWMLQVIGNLGQHCHLRSILGLASPACTADHPAKVAA